MSKTFNRGMIVSLRYAYHLKNRFSRLRGAGFMTAEEMARKLNVLRSTVKEWRDRGLLRAHRYNDKGNACMNRQTYSSRRSSLTNVPIWRHKKMVLHSLDEVQCEA